MSVSGAGVPALSPDRVPLYNSPPASPVVEETDFQLGGPVYQPTTLAAPGPYPASAKGYTFLSYLPLLFS